MADIKLEPQEADLLRSFSPLQEFKPEVNLQYHDIISLRLPICLCMMFCQIMPATSDSQLEAKQEDTPVVVEEGAAQDMPQDQYLRPINVASHGMTNVPPPPSVSHLHTVCVLSVLLSGHTSTMLCQWLNTHITM